MKSRRILSILSLVLVAIPMLVSCGQRVTGPEQRLRIVTSAEAQDSIVIWDPNVRDVLWVSADGLPADQLEDLAWHQVGLPVDDSDWHGRDLNLFAGVPGCGYGGVKFTVTATLPDSPNAASVTVLMKLFVCSGPH